MTQEEIESKANEIIKAKSTYNNTLRKCLIAEICLKCGHPTKEILKSKKIFFVLSVDDEHGPHCYNCGWEYMTKVFHCTL